MLKLIFITAIVPNICGNQKLDYMEHNEQNISVIYRLIVDFMPSVQKYPGHALN